MKYFDCERRFQGYFPNSLSLNVMKTKFMLVSKKGHITIYDFNLKVNGYTIEQVTEFKSLGMILNQHLGWQSHCCNRMYSVWD